MSNPANKRHPLLNLPTPIAGLALGLMSLGLCLDTVWAMNGLLQAAMCLLPALLLLLLAARFLLFPKQLLSDLKHPVIGSVAPTFSMALMLLSHALFNAGYPLIAHSLWLFAIALHCIFMGLFFYYRSRQFNWQQLVPSWFIPPVGIITAAVSYQGAHSDLLFNIAQWCLYFGLFSYAILLPLMLYRSVFKATIAPQAQPTIAILAAPASLSLAGYLALSQSPSMLFSIALLGLALTMTLLVYVAFFQLLRLPFSVGYSAFTFPLAIGASALYQLSSKLSAWGVPADSIAIINRLALFELTVAVVIISYVSLRFILFYLPVRPTTTTALTGSPKE